MPGLADLLAPEPAALPVLMYHSVSEVAGGPMRPLAVPAARLAEQLMALRSEGYRLTGLSEALRVRADDPHAPVVAVTFDDGFRDFLTDGLPVLASVGASATLYVAVAHVGKRAAWMGEHARQFGPMLTWEEIGEVAAAGIEIGNHSLVHTPMDVMPARALEFQVRASRELLRQHTQLPIQSFAYPHGYNSRRVRAAVARSGHQTACEVGHGLYHPDGRALDIPRLQVTSDHSGPDLVELVRTGGPRLLPMVKDAAQPGWRAVRRVAGDVFGWHLT
jgi:peptidoglycan/xylan/chitin deacetylase (PgdA/CDA1 family)